MDNLRKIQHWTLAFQLSSCLGGCECVVVGVEQWSFGRSETKTIALPRHGRHRDKVDTTVTTGTYLKVRTLGT